jgi:hypothetical protein
MNRGTLIYKGNPEACRQDGTIILANDIFAMPFACWFSASSSVMYLLMRDLDALA